MQAMATIMTRVAAVLVGLLACGLLLHIASSSRTARDDALRHDPNKSTAVVSANAVTRQEMEAYVAAAVDALRKDVERGAVAGAAGVIEAAPAEAKGGSNPEGTSANTDTGCPTPTGPFVRDWERDPYDQSAADINAATFARMREEGLARAAARATTDYLAGIDSVHPAFGDAIRSVCGAAGLRDPANACEVEQMCRRRGRRMAEDMMHHYGHALNFSLVRREMTSALSTLRLELALEGGQLTKYRFGSARAWGSRPLYPFMNFLRLRKEGRLPKRRTSLLFDPNDSCHGARPKWPLTAFTARPSCPGVVATSGSVYQQQLWFDPPNKPRAELSDDVFFRGSALADRPLFAVAARSGLFPYLNVSLNPLAWAKDPSAALTGRCVQTTPKLCEEFPNAPATFCTEMTHCQNNTADSVFTRGKEYYSWVEMTNYRVYLSLAGLALPYRLNRFLMAPGVTMDVQPIRERMSFSFHPDLIEWVHYVPIAREEALKLTSMNESYHHLMRNADVEESIAAESSRWARLHAGARAFLYEYDLFAHLTAALTPADYQPDPDWEYKPVPATDCSSQDAFWKSCEDLTRVIPVNDQKEKAFLYSLACGLDLPRGVSYPG